ncbi:MAG: glycosyl hydrolase, partial [Gemmatimonadetes bacterium]|nr:glycosyl hydrolase [Gemmatimonadota bacterium]
MSHIRIHHLLLALALLFPVTLLAQDDEENGDENGGRPSLDSSLLKGLEFRAIGPALTSGRIGDLAILPDHPTTWYVGVSSGGVWKTVNAGVTWKPIFDSYDSYSIGAVTVDPNDPLVVWVGTGENNSQRSVGYGDGLYKSIDGGHSFDLVGLEQSEHIAKIVVDPRDSDIVLVAAQGPLWASGGDRGLFRTSDGGTTWDLVLEIDENTGVT